MESLKQGIFKNGNGVCCNIDQLTEISFIHNFLKNNLSISIETITILKIYLKLILSLFVPKKKVTRETSKLIWQH